VSTEPAAGQTATTALNQFSEAAYDDWLASVYDAWYPDLWDEDEGPFAPLYGIVQGFEDLSVLDPNKIRILDCACGTGNIYVPFAKREYEIWGTDGSERMLDRAVENCEQRHISTERLIKKAIRWTDLAAYREYFKENSFDLIFLSSNSFCHLPGAIIPQALQNFKWLLKPNGRLLIDTKKFKPAGKINGVPILKELRFVNDAWIIRTERTDPDRDVNGIKVNFQTWLHYDVDPCFRTCRGIIVVTMYGEHFPRRTRVLSYYPLPARVLRNEMSKLGFRTLMIPARSEPLNWSYDFLIGTKVEGRFGGASRLLGLAKELVWNSGSR
jgi:SAM-dependent methyltransferase